jgi:hypothetical protein
MECDEKKVVADLIEREVLAITGAPEPPKKTPERRRPPRKSVYG